MRQISLNDTLHGKILQCVSADLAAFLSNSPKHQNLTEHEQLAMLFKNYRAINGKPQGLRLTGVGNEMLSKHYTQYSYEYTDRLNNKLIIELDKTMKWPYYLTGKHVVFHSEEDAAWFRLNGNSLSQYVNYI